MAESSAGDIAPEDEPDPDSPEAIARHVSFSAALPPPPPIPQSLTDFFEPLITTAEILDPGAGVPSETPSGAMMRYSVERWAEAAGWMEALGQMAYDWPLAVGRNSLPKRARELSLQIDGASRPAEAWEDMPGRAHLGMALRRELDDDTHLWLLGLVRPVPGSDNQYAFYRRKFFVRPAYVPAWSNAASLRTQIAARKPQHRAGAKVVRRSEAAWKRRLGRWWREAFMKESPPSWGRRSGSPDDMDYLQGVFDCAYKRRRIASQRPSPRQMASLMNEILLADREKGLNPTARDEVDRQRLHDWTRWGWLKWPEDAAALTAFRS